MAATSNDSALPAPPHLLLLPYPFQGHFSPFINLALKLSSSFHASITFLTTHHSLFRLLRSANLTEASSFPDFMASQDSSAPDTILRFHYDWRQLGFEVDSHVCLVGVSDGLSADDDRVDLPGAYMRSLDNNLERGVDAYMSQNKSSHSHSHSHSHGITCIISDSYMSYTQDIAHRFGIPWVFVWTQSLAVLSAQSNMSALGYDPSSQKVTCRGQLKPLVVDSLPGLPPIDPYDLPYYCAGFDEEIMKWSFDALREQLSRINEADWVFVNSFEEIEGSILEALKPSIPKLMMVGPLNTVIQKHLEGSDGQGRAAFRASIMEDDMKCMEWLDSKTRCSVLFISFGSVHELSASTIAVISEALVRLWKGGEGFSCLWVCRNWDKDMVGSEFLEEVENGRVMVIRWASQVEVLSHPSIGGFVSHMGWNSTLESLSSGVPLICCPAFLDQYTNSWSAVYRWNVGLELHSRRDDDGDGDGGNKLGVDEVESAIRCLMAEAKGAELRHTASSLKEAALRAWDSSHGSSHKNLQTFIHYLSKP